MTQATPPAGPTLPFLEIVPQVAPVRRLLIVRIASGQGPAMDAVPSLLLRPVHREPLDLQSRCGTATCRAVTYSVLRSLPPKTQLVGVSGVGDEAELLALGAEDVDAAGLARAGRGVDVALHVACTCRRCRGPCRSRAAPSSSPTRAVLLERVGQQVAVALGVVVGQVERLHVGRQDDAVGLLHVGDDLRHRAVGVDAVDALGVDLARLVADVARVGEVDAALACRWSGRWGC